MESPVITTPPSQPHSRRSRLTGGIIAVLVMAGLGALAWYLLHPSEDAAPGAGGRRGAPSTTVGVATAKKTDIPIMLDALGTVTAAATATVRPQVSGILTKINFSEGQLVKAGQVLAVIDPRPFEMALLQASGQRQRDEAQLDSARVTLARYRTLLEQDSIARQEVDTQSALVKQLEGTVMTDRAAEGMAKLNLSFTRITAPITGRVGLRVIDLGNLVGSGDTNGIAVITQLSPVDVEFAVPQDRVPELQARIVQNASLTAIALDRTRSKTLETGKFAALDNQVDVQTGTVRAKARFANAGQTLFPSQFVNLRLELNVIKDAIMVPVTALRHGSAGDFVYVLNAKERTVALRPVVRGQATIENVEVKSGLKEGEQVITEGADRLKDGSTVTLPGDKPAMAGGGRRRGGAVAPSPTSVTAASTTAATTAAPASATEAAPASSALPAVGEGSPQRQKAAQ